MTDKILRWPDLRELVPLSRNTVTKLEREGRFPRRYQLTDYTIGWRFSEVQAWIKGKREWAQSP